MRKIKRVPPPRAGSTQRKAKPTRTRQQPADDTAATAGASSELLEALFETAELLHRSAREEPNNVLLNVAARWQHVLFSALRRGDTENLHKWLMAVPKRGAHSPRAYYEAHPPIHDGTRGPTGSLPPLPWIDREYARAQLIGEAQKLIQSRPKKKKLRSWANNSATRMFLAVRELVPQCSVHPETGPRLSLGELTELTPVGQEQEPTLDAIKARLQFRLAPIVNFLIGHDDVPSTVRERQKRSDPELFVVAALEAAGMKNSDAHDFIKRSSSSKKPM